MNFDPNYDLSDFLPTNSHNVDINLDIAGPSCQNHTSDLKTSDLHQQLVMENLQDTTMAIKTEYNFGDLLF